MLPALTITLREGLEAFLIVAISLAYLRKTGRDRLVPAVHWGIGLSIVISIAAAWLFSKASNQALWEGCLALTAAVLVATLIVHMWRHGKRLKREIETRLESSALQIGTKAFVGVFLFTVLMITREGMETALLMGTLISQNSAANIIAARQLGVCARRSSRGCGPDTGTASIWPCSSRSRRSSSPCSSSSCSSTASTN
jgi:high-affinity iron transporter